MLSAGSLSRYKDLYTAITDQEENGKMKNVSLYFIHIRVIPIFLFSVLEACDRVMLQSVFVSSAVISLSLYKTSYQFTLRQRPRRTNIRIRSY